MSASGSEPGAGRASGAGSAELVEAVAVLLCEVARHDSSAALTATVEGLLGAHPRISGRAIQLRLDEFLARSRHFRDHRVPAYRAYQKRRNELVAAERRGCVLRSSSRR